MTGRNSCSSRRSVTTETRRPLTLLVDAASLIYRAYYSTPDTVKSDAGKPVNAAHGFLGMLARLVADRDPDFLACADDADWRPQWRVDLIPSYKTHRVAPPEGSAAAEAEDSLEHQIPLIYKILEELDVAVVGAPSFEAEDVIAVLAARAEGYVEIVSGDRDLFQLVSDPKICVLYPKRGVSDLTIVDEKYIHDRFGIPGRAYGDYAVMRGDSSDGLPGVSGVGEKTAAALLNRYGSLEQIVEAALTEEKPSTALSRIKMAIDYLDRAVKVVLLPPDLKIPKVDLHRPRKEPTDDLVEFAAENGLAGAVRRLGAALSGRTSAAT